MKNEILIYQTQEHSPKLEVRVDEDTVWLSLNQIAQLFERDKSVISRDLRNVYEEGELSIEATVAKNATVQIESGREVKREIEYYNLDAILSVGYRVNSKQGTHFRIWANKVLKEYLLKGYAINSACKKTPTFSLSSQRIQVIYTSKRPKFVVSDASNLKFSYQSLGFLQTLNNRIDRIEDDVHFLKEKAKEFDFQIKTSLPPHEGFFCNGQIFDAWVFVSKMDKCFFGNTINSIWKSI